MKNLLKFVFGFICTEFRSLPKDFQVAYYNISSLLYSSLTTLLIADLTKLHVSNQYGELLIATFIAGLNVTFNVLQYKLAKFGEKLHSNAFNVRADKGDDL